MKDIIDHMMIKIKKYVRNDQLKIVKNAMEQKFIIYAFHVLIR